MPIVRNGELEATNYFFGVPGQDEELEFTFNHDGRTSELGTAYGHIALAVDDLDETLARLKHQASSRSASRTAFARAAPGSVSSRIGTSTGSS